MNKSKFLKKSLAAVLAVLLIAAMIPLSAAAVDAPPVSKITVGGVEATGTGTNREVNLVESAPPASSGGAVGRKQWRQRRFCMA